MKCPRFEQLLDYSDGLLADEGARLVATHLNSGCRRCSGNIEWYERVRAIALSDDAPEPPAWVLKRAHRLFDGLSRAEPLRDRIGKVVASLVFDSLTRPALPGVRLTETTNRQLLYRAGEYNIDLQVASFGQSSADLMGQVLRESEHGFASVVGLSVGLVKGAELVRSAVTDSVGEFTLKMIDQGEYDLLVSARGLDITIQGLPITSY